MKERVKQKHSRNTKMVKEKKEIKEPIVRDSRLESIPEASCSNEDSSKGKYNKQGYQLPIVKPIELLSDPQKSKLENLQQ